MRITPTAPIYKLGDKPRKTAEELAEEAKERREKRADLAYKRKIHMRKGAIIDTKA